MEGEVIYFDDSRFDYSLKLLPNTTLDMNKFDYTPPTRSDLYKQKLNGFSDLAHEIIDLWEIKTSNNSFKRSLKKLHADYKRGKP